MPESLPKVDFSMLVLSLSQTALVHLGEGADPDSTDSTPDSTSALPEPDLALARQTIDILGMLQEKTRGNLDGSEERLIDQVLYDLRMRFVESSKSAPTQTGAKK